MRKNQVTITVLRTGSEVPENRQKDKTTNERVSAIEISTYVDSDNVFEALSKAYHNIIHQISLEQQVPAFGADDGVLIKVKGYYPQSNPDDWENTL